MGILQDLVWFNAPRGDDSSEFLVESVFAQVLNTNPSGSPERPGSVKGWQPISAHGRGHGANAGNDELGEQS